jgi:hypothetical protein
MAEYASDIVMTEDYSTVTGALTLQVMRASHAPLTVAQANAFRNAYLAGSPGPTGTGWASMRALWGGYDPRAGAWLDSMSAPERTGLLYLLSRGAWPSPPPPGAP